jgi:WD40-like Beta Propeller Repeat
MQLSRLAVVVVVLSLSASCSAPEASGGRPSGSSMAGAAAGSGLPKAGSGSIGVPGIDGGLVPIVPLPPTAQAGSDSQMPMKPSTGPISIDECGASNPAGLNDADRQKLMAAGSGGAPQILYPYAGTVFPRGILAPLVMWADMPADAVYVHIKSRSFEYKGCLKPTAPGQLQLPQEPWKQGEIRTYGKNDPYTLEIALWSGGNASGKATLDFKIAQATVKGSIFYNSYSSALPGATGGNVLRIPPGGKAEIFISGACNGCHSVSADGSRLLAQINLVSFGSAFELTANSGPNPPGATNAGPRGSYGALYPDGSKYLSTSVQMEVARANLAQGLGATPDATLYDTTTGMVVPNTGIPTGAMMPMFSPDGTRLAFNDFAIEMGHGLAIMNYDTKTDTASGYKMLAKEADPMRPAWPFVLPDNGGVIYTKTDSADFSGLGAGLLGALIPGPFSELQIVDVASGKVSVLAKAMGYASEQDAAMGKTYLPFGAEELSHNYFPTVSPVAAGGYFWVFFDAVRHYGNQGLQRQLWGAAIDISPDGKYLSDPSHPAFYLPGQEFGTGNHRAFAALDPCKRDGDTCATGIDCCGGFCKIPEGTNNEFGQAVGMCSSDMPMCAKRDERCVTDSDCCPSTGNEPQNVCIAGFCAFVELK